MITMWICRTCRKGKLTDAWKKHNLSFDPNLMMTELNPEKEAASSMATSGHTFSAKTRKDNSYMTLAVPSKKH